MLLQSPVLAQPGFGPRQSSVAAAGHHNRERGMSLQGLTAGVGQKSPLWSGGLGALLTFWDPCFSLRRPLILWRDLRRSGSA